MQLKTTDSKFLEYGNTFFNPDLLANKIIVEIKVTSDCCSNIYYTNDDIFIKECVGISTITIGRELDSLKTFILSKTIRIDKGCFFHFSSLTKRSEVILYLDTENDLMNTKKNSTQAVNKISSSFQITELYFCSYSIKTAGYHFDTESHNCWELTFVDEGKLNTKIDGVTYSLQSNQFIFYVPNQEHSQDIPKDSNCSYVTIVFETNLNEYHFLSNKVFDCDNDLLNIFNFFIQSNINKKFINDYSILKLKELIILTYNQQHQIESNDGSHYYSKLLNSIIDYINENLNYELTVDQICHVFGISRTTIQKIFQKNLNVSPKSYIIYAKLSYSKILLKQNKYTIEEIAGMAGFTTANYFTRMFKKTYDISPTNYLKSLKTRKNRN